MSAIVASGPSPLPPEPIITPVFCTYATILLLNGNTAVVNNVMLDSGAEGDLISRRCLNTLQLPCHQLQQPITFGCANAGGKTCTHYSTFTLSIGGGYITHSFFVDEEDLEQSITLGQNGQYKFRIVYDAYRGTATTSTGYDSPVFIRRHRANHTWRHATFPPLALEFSDFVYLLDYYPANPQHG